MAKQDPPLPDAGRDAAAHPPAPSPPLPGAAAGLLDDPVGLLVGRAVAIDRWRATGARLNVMELGAALVCGVLRRGRLAVPPITAFDTPAAAATTTADPPQPLHVPPREHAPHDAADEPAGHRVSEHSGKTPSARLPSVARRVLVQMASIASVPLYMGMLASLVGNGVTSFCDAEESAATAVMDGGLHTSGRRLRIAAAMTSALHEVHAAAGELLVAVHCIAAETRSLEASANAAAETGDGDAAQERRHVLLGRSCRRMSRTVANLYSLLALLDFFAVDDVAPHHVHDARGGARHPRPSAAAAEVPPRPYTAERLRELLRRADYLPESVWMVFAAVAAKLSHFGVSWSLTARDMENRRCFNSVAGAVLSEDQRCLLLQLHRLCTRFTVLQQRVCGLYPTSPLRFKVRQMLEWGNLLDADTPDAWSLSNSDVDRCDLHDSRLYNTCARGRRWRVDAANRGALKAAAACPYSDAARASALRRIAERAAAAPQWDRDDLQTGDTASAMPLSQLAPTTAAAERGGAVATTAVATSTASATTPAAAHGSLLSAVPGYVGLRNSGNTCFLNSVVQLLASAAPFRRDLLSRVQDAVFGPARRASAAAVAAESAAAMASLVATHGCRLTMVLLLAELQWRAAHHHECHPVLPDYFITHLPPPFNDHHQHDASEFWHALMDQLDVPSQPGGAVVARWFSGRTTTRMTCTVCRHPRLHSDTFWDLSTPLLRRPATSPTDTHIARAATPPAAATAAEAVEEQPAGVVEVQRFPGATAVTTTYMDAPPSGAVRGGDGAADEERGERDVNKGAPAPLQHLLLHVLHPALNGELLHGSNALDCEHCGRRTDTELTTRLEAEAESAPPPDAHTCVGGAAREAAGAPTQEQQPLADTAAGAGLPFYLVVQLNRFAFQRTTQSYEKIVDGVPLNDVVVVPVFNTARADGDGGGGGGGGEEEEQQQQQRRRSDAVSGGGAAAVEAPVWVAYRLRSIVIHSGSTPNSGHYFTLVRSSSSSNNSGAAAAVEEEGEADGLDGGGAAGMAAARTYVHELAAALTRCLGAVRHGCEEEEAPALPPAAVSVHGDGVYDAWVMLNDSNVTRMEAERMREVLHGRGGVHSPLETPYLVLYEKMPVACEAGQPAAAASGSAVSRLRQLWESSGSAVGVCGSGDDADVTSLDAEVLRILTARLAGDVSGGGASSDVWSSPSAATGVGGPPVGVVVREADSAPTATATVVASSRTASCAVARKDALSFFSSGSGSVSRGSALSRSRRPASSVKSHRSHGTHRPGAVRHHHQRHHTTDGRQRQRLGSAARVPAALSSSASDVDSSDEADASRD